ncbi:hypothetical protein [Pararobbsia silviterrae]|uniref:Uncharacterized protein n=1 Tax=Pararobbsia silviterrae TaxID=1792498 RepID=A0A494Y883_9BURK|nr:hypothetical protein [Pararobbsia silviterrae]RKP58892.1 hypothetical protein D7S86_02920 [Pararobbsia silviterrae]
MAVRISGPYKGFYITVEATPSPDLRPRDARPAFAATTYIYRHAPSGDGRGIKVEVSPGRRFASVADAFVVGETFAHAQIDEIEV